MHGTHVASTLSRRHFILTAVTATGGFMIGIGAAPRAAGAATVGIAPGSDENAYSPNDIDAWIAIDPDDSILIRYQRSEMGQGAADDDCRGTAVRLVEGADQVCLTEPESAGK
jgi:hypothetical protein